MYKQINRLINRYRNVSYNTHTGGLNVSYNTHIHTHTHTDTGKHTHTKYTHIDKQIYRQINRLIDYKSMEISIKTLEVTFVSYVAECFVQESGYLIHRQFNRILAQIKRMLYLKCPMIIMRGTCLSYCVSWTPVRAQRRWSYAIRHSR